MLKQQSDQIAQEYSEAAIELESLRYLIDENRQKLEKAQSDYKQAKEVLGTRLKAIYMAGDVDPVEVMLESTTFDDMLNRYDFLNHIANQDLNVFKEVKALRREISSRQRDLEDQEARQQLAVNQIQQKQAELQASLKAQEALLASVNAEVLQLLSSYGVVLQRRLRQHLHQDQRPLRLPLRRPPHFHQRLAGAPRVGGTSTRAATSWPPWAPPRWPASTAPSPG